MTNFLLLSSVLQFLISSPSVSFNQCLLQCSQNDIEFAQDNSINDWMDYRNYLISKHLIQIIMTEH